MNNGANVVPEVDLATTTTMEDTTNDDGTITRSVYLDESQAGELPSSISFNGETDLLTVEKLKIDNVTDTSYMFNGCSNLTYVPAKSWDGSKILNADYMFAGCSSLTKDPFIILEPQQLGAESSSSMESEGEIFIHIEEDDYIHVGNYKDLQDIMIKDGTNREEYRTWINKTIGDNYVRYEFEQNANINGNLIYITVNDNGDVYVELSNKEEVTSVNIVGYFIARQFELPNVESAVCIFDGCTNLE